MKPTNISETHPSYELLTAKPCTLCGACNPDKAKSCLECGALQTASPRSSFQQLERVLPESKKTIDQSSSAESEPPDGIEPSPFSNEKTKGAKETRIAVIAAASLLLLMMGAVLLARNSKTPPSIQSAMGDSPQSATPPSRILTKDTEFMKLLHPASGEALLEQSANFQQKKKEIESKLGQIQDAELRSRVSTEEWSKVDKDAFIHAEARKQRLAFPSAISASLAKHRNDWFELGHVKFTGLNALQISSVEASPIVLPSGTAISIDVGSMDAVYSRFRELAKDQIEKMGREWVYNQSCQKKLRNVCINLGGSESECSSHAKLSEIEQSLPGVLAGSGCNDNASLEDGMRAVEAKMRPDRIVLVGLGDLVAQKIDKVMLVDYDTETILHDFGQSQLGPFGVRWKFSDTDGTGRTLLTTYDFLSGKETDGKSIFVSSPGTYAESASSLKDVDFKNRTYRYAGGETVEIRSGAYRLQLPIGFEEVKVVDIWFVSDSTNKSRFAVVSIGTVGCGASCSFERDVQVYALVDNRVEMVQELGFDDSAAGSGAWFDAKSQRLTIRARSNDDSPRCCAKRP